MSLGQFGFGLWRYLLIHNIDFAFSLLGWHKHKVLVSFATLKSSVGPVLVEIQVFEVLTDLLSDGTARLPGGTACLPGGTDRLPGGTALQICRWHHLLSSGSSISSKGSFQIVLSQCLVIHKCTEM